jgi:hypothetical protein
MITPSRAVLAAVALSLVYGCSPDAPNLNQVSGPEANRAGFDSPGVHRQYGPPQKVGEGMARTYVVVDAKNEQTPLELGIALDAKALDGLPDAMSMYAVILKFPKLAPAPYQFVELDWNPHGHEPPEIYTVPHFDFHFYTISLAERNSILPSDPQFAAKASNLPTGEFVPPFYVVPGPPAAVAVPMMGVHWSDVRSPELQGLLGHPELYQPFTRTFIYGSWNGRISFYEPMVTREYLLSHPDFEAEIPVPARYPAAGYYPTAYRVTYDAQVKEYRVALTSLVQRP